jgi:hypothetical protein
MPSRPLRTAVPIISDALLRDEVEVEDGEHEVHEEGQDEGNDHRLVRGVARPLGPPLAYMPL